MTHEHIPTNYIILSIIKYEGKTRFLELAIKRGGERYLISVADGEYIRNLKESNSYLPPEFREPENILQMDALDPIEKVSQKLSELPDEVLHAYIEPVPEE